MTTRFETKYCIEHEHWYPVEHGICGEGHIVVMEDGIDFCHSPLMTSEPPQLSEEYWNWLMEQEEYDRL